MKTSERNDAAICKHVDAIATLLNGQVVGLMAITRDGDLELVCPENGRDAAAAWLSLWIRRAVGLMLA